MYSNVFMTNLYSFVYLDENEDRIGASENQYGEFNITWFSLDSGLTIIIKIQETLKPGRAY